MMEPRSAQVPRFSEWLLLVGGVGALVSAVGFVGMRLVRPMLAPRNCCAPVPEPKANLLALFTSERAFFQEKDFYSEDMGLVGFAPGPGNRYTYFAATHGPVSRPSHLVAADPKAPSFRGSFSSFWQTGCPLTPAVLPDGTRAGLGVTLPPGGDSSTAVFIGAAAANIDDDPTPDCWSIATVERVATDGTRIGAGEPYGELNDVVH